ncbi:MAG: metallophosphoesterase [Bacteroidales bacterium]|nr:metallophosphoesterase [Bacteroidales bacterium]
MRRYFFLLFICSGLWTACDRTPLSFGVITDVHYSASRPEKGNRLYSLSKGKLQDAVSAFNVEDLSFVVSLGDLRDNVSEPFSDLAPVFEELRFPVFFIPGNHDHDSDFRPYTKRLGRYRLIFLDSNAVASYSTPGEDGELEQYIERRGADYKNWNGALGCRQREWLEKRLRISDLLGENVICFSHMPVVPTDSMYSLLDAPEAEQILSRHKSVKAYICGHHHKGAFSSIGGRIPHLMLQGMIEGRENHFSIITVTDDEVSVKGFGAQTDYSASL